MKSLNTNIITIFALCFCCFYSKGQNLMVNYQECTNCTGDASTIPTNGFTYGNIQSMETIDIVSDFGMRICDGCSKWHKGIDLSTEINNGDTGDRILSIDEGTLVRIAGATNNYKYISIEGDNSFGYGHIFRNGAVPSAGMRSGDFVFKRILGAVPRYAIIYAPEDGDTSAISTQLGDLVVFNGDTLTTTNIINQTQAIAPVGTSGMVEAHIHLYYFVEAGSSTSSPVNNSNSKDPLEVLSHTQTVYDVTIDTIVSHNGGLRNSVKVVCEMQNADDNDENNKKYNNVTMNINQVEVFMKKKQEPFANFVLIKGAYFDAKISHGATSNTIRYPSVGNPVGNTHDIVSAYGALGSGTNNDYLRTGIDPEAYDKAAGHGARDNFYFTDIPTRIHKDDNYGRNNAIYANVIQDARYSDGEHDLYVKMTTIRDSIHISDTSISNIKTILIDNFRPYIKKVTIQDEVQFIYDADWIWNENYTTDDAGNPLGALEFQRDFYEDTPGDENLSITITTSEPMNTLSLNVNGTSYTANSSMDKTLWDITIPFTDLVDLTGTQTLEFTGTDLADNPLMGFNDEATYTANELPYRTGATTWSTNFNDETDTAHSFNIDPCTNAGNRIATGCIVADYIVELPCNDAIDFDTETICIGTPLNFDPSSTIGIRPVTY